MTDSWVFAGSAFWTDTTTGEKYYQADGGDFICVSNFPTALLDLPIASTQTNDSLLFTAATERIPPLGTKVRLVLIPRRTRTKKRGKRRNRCRPSHRRSDDIPHAVEDGTIRAVAEFARIRALLGDSPNSGEFSYEPMPTACGIESPASVL